jgi:hypothetical protein
LVKTRSTNAGHNVLIGTTTKAPISLGQGTWFKLIAGLLRAAS